MPDTLGLEGGKVIHKNLWIAKVIHALTVTPRGVIHALTVTLSRINCHAPISTCSSPVFKTPVSDASHSGDNPVGLTPIRSAAVAKER